MYLYHGTDIESAKNIAKYGVDIKKSHKGYFGIGFYTATNENLAKSNYADFADDEGEPGTVLKFKLNSNAKILDLDKPKDFEEYKNAKWKGVPITDLRHLDNFNEIMVDLGFDGLRDEGSFGGIVVYNPKSIKLVEELKFASKNIALQYLADFTGQKVKIAENCKYPKAGSTVDGLKVRSEIPNTESISATFTDYSELPGIREISMSKFGGPKSVFYATNDFEKSRNLAEKIKESGEINPLIIAVDKDGSYILEGAHRFVALHYLDKKSFPALVVIDEDEGNNKTASDETSKYHGDIEVLKKEAEKYKSGEELLRSGGFSIEALDRAAFGFANEDIKELDPKDLNIQWTGDYENVKSEVENSGLSDKEWSKKISLDTPIEVVYKDGKFYIDDGHHRYFAAKTLGKKLKVNLRIEEKPIPKIVGKKNYDYDEFHRSFFASALVSLLDVVDEDTLNNEREEIYHLVDPEEEERYVYKVQKISAKNAKRKFKTMKKDMTVFESFINYATENQKEIVKDKMKNFDANRVIITTSGSVVDGNHHTIAAIELDKPIKYIDLRKPIEKKMASSMMEVYRGEFSGNKDGKYWSTDREWAAQFTQTGRIEEVKSRKIKEQDIFSPDILPYAGDPNEIDEAVKEAKRKGFKYVRLNEGRNEPDSIYIF